jgi:hypothetical protein
VAVPLRIAEVLGTYAQTTSFIPSCLLPPTTQSRLPSAPLWSLRSPVIVGMFCRGLCRPPVSSLSHRASSSYSFSCFIQLRGRCTVFDITEDLVRGAPDDSDIRDFPTYCAPSLTELVDLLPLCVPECFERQDGQMKQKRTIYFLVEGYRHPYTD